MLRLILSFIIFIHGLIHIIILAACILSYGTWSFNKMVNEELQSFLPNAIEKKFFITEMVAHLPSVVQKWLERSNIIGKEVIQTVHLKQKGEMRTKLDGSWMPVEAEQYFTVEKPGFIWIGDVEAAPFVYFSGRDKYEEGRGHMLIKVLSLYLVVNSIGKEIDQGNLLRYLAEIVWFPSAALSNYIAWEELDSTSAKVTMSYSGITASGVFAFNADGDEENGYREFEGIRISAKSTVTWKLKTGDFNWFN